MPPGKAIKISDRSYIFCFLSCIFFTVYSLLIFVLIISFLYKIFGITPITFPLFFRTSFAINPIRPIFAPPYTRDMLFEAIILPIFFVSSIIILSLELLDAQKTQIFFDIF